MNDAVPESVPSGAFAEAIGVEWLDLDPDGARARIAVGKMHLQPYGIVHGGVYSSLAESLTSAATYDAVKDEGKVAMGQANDTSFLRPITRGPRQRRRASPATAAARPGSGTSR